MIIYFIPSSFVVFFLMTALGLLGIGMEAVLWIAENIIPISVVIWVIVFMAVYSRSERGERILRASEAFSFFPFYMGLVLILLKWARMLDLNGLRGILSFILYIVDIPILAGLYLLPSFLILKASRSLFQRGLAPRILFNLFSSIAYLCFLCFKNYHMIQSILH